MARRRRRPRPVSDARGGRSQRRPGLGGLPEARGRRLDAAREAREALPGVPRRVPRPPERLRREALRRRRSSGGRRESDRLGRDDCRGGRGGEGGAGGELGGARGERGAGDAGALPDAPAPAVRAQKRPREAAGALGALPVPALRAHLGGEVRARGEAVLEVRLESRRGFLRGARRPSRARR